MIGTLIDDRFLVKSLLGKGGMAEVYLALDQRLDRQVALKVMAEHTLLMPKSQARFVREFKSIAALSQPNIIKLFHNGVTKGGRAYYTMEYIKGRTLAEIIANEKIVAPIVAAKLLLQVVSAFEVYHEARIVHRDLKPANLLIEGSDLEKARVVLADFGLVRITDVTAITETGAMLGTPFYMSPEQVKGKRVDYRSDYYQLGVIAYEMLTGKQLVDGVSVAKILSHILYKTQIPVRQFLPNLAPQWDEFFAKTLDKDREERFQSAQEIVEVLEAITTCQDIRRKAIGPDQVPSLTRDKEARRGIFGAFAFAFVVLLLLIYFAFRTPDKITYSVRDLQTMVSVRSLKLRWKSSVAYPSRVRIRDGLSNIVVQGKESHSVTDHEVTIMGLEGGKSYSLQVVYPDGSTSFAKTVKTKEFRLDLVHSSSNEDGTSIKLILKPTPRTKNGVLSFHMQHSGKLTVLGKLEDDGDIVFTINRSAEVVEKLSFHGTFVSGNSCSYDLKQALSSKVSSLCNRLGSFDSKNLVESIHRRSLPKPQTMFNAITKDEFSSDGVASRAQEKRMRDLGNDFVQESILLALHDAPQWQDYLKGVELSHLVFSNKILPFPLRRDFHRKLERFYAIYLYVGFKADRLTIPVPTWEQYGVSLKKYGSRPKEIIVLSEAVSPAFVGAGVPYEGIPSKADWNYTFEVENVKKWKVLEFHIRAGFFKDNAARITVNDQDATYFHREGLASNWAKDEIAGLFVRLPNEVLIEGENRLSLSYANLFGNINTEVIPIYAIKINLYE